MQISNPHRSPPGQTVAAMVAVTRAAGTIPSAANRDLSMVEPSASGWAVDGVTVTISEEAKAAADAAISEVATRRGITFDDRMTALVYRDFAGREAGEASTAPPGAPVWDAPTTTTETTTTETTTTETTTTETASSETQAADPSTGAATTEGGDAGTATSGGTASGETGMSAEDVEDLLESLEENASQSTSQTSDESEEDSAGLASIDEGYADEQTDLMIGDAPDYVEDSDDFSLSGFDTSDEGPGWFSDDDENTATAVDVVEF